MHTTTRRTAPTTRAMISAADAIQRALAHASIRLDDFSGRDAIAFLQEAGEHALTVHAMVSEKVKELESTRGA